MCGKICFYFVGTRKDKNSQSLNEKYNLHEKGKPVRAWCVQKLIDLRCEHIGRYIIVKTSQKMMKNNESLEKKKIRSVFACVASDVTLHKYI